MLSETLSRRRWLVGTLPGHGAGNSVTGPTSSLSLELGGGESSWIVRHGTQGNPEEHVQLVVIDYGHPLRVQEARNLA